MPPAVSANQPEVQTPGGHLGTPSAVRQNWPGRDVADVSGQDERTSRLAEGQEFSRPGWLHSWHSGRCLAPCRHHRKVAAARSGALTSFAVVTVQQADLRGKRGLLNAARALLDLLKSPLQLRGLPEPAAQV